MQGSQKICTGRSANKSPSITIIYNLSNGISFKQAEEIPEKNVLRIQVAEDEIDVVPQYEEEINRIVKKYVPKNPENCPTELLEETTTNKISHYKYFILII